MKNRLYTVTLTILLFCLPGWSWSADKALLVGVGKYVHTPEANLPGIDTDIEIMKELTQLLGITKSQTKVLLDEDATLANVRGALTNWLREDVKPNDRVFVYISSHGTQIHDENGDEQSDNVDEVLTMHDLEHSFEGNKVKLNGVLVDDEFESLLSKIPSDNVYVFVDACHSGTTTKGLQLPTRSFGKIQTVSKFYSYPGMPMSGKGDFLKTRSFTAVAREKNILNHVLLAAAQEFEESLATTNGSIFTLGLQQTIRELANRGAAISMTDLHRRVTTFVENILQDGVNTIFHPFIGGSPRLQSQAINIKQPEAGNGPQLRRIKELVDGSERMTASLNQAEYKDGDILELELNVPHDGYLNVVNIGATDKATILFPNKYEEDNKVMTGVLKLPTEALPFELKATAPFGPSAIAIFVSSVPVNLYTSGWGERNNSGELEDVFSGLSTHDLRSFVATPRESQLSSTILETNVSAK